MSEMRQQAVAEVAQAISAMKRWRGQKSELLHMLMERTGEWLL